MNLLRLGYVLNIMSTSTSDDIKQLVKAKYGEIAKTEPSASGSCCGGTKKATPSSSCCGGGGSGPPPTPKACCGNGVSNLMADDYKDIKGYNPDADLGLGCGLPTKFAKIKEGDTVLDLGSGAGNDCFVARSETGPTGKVIGVDFTPSMVERARQNAARRGFTNVEFVEGDIEQLPLGDNIVDVVVSNCVLNLVPSKDAVFQEIMRVLKPGGHFSVSDIVLEGALPDKIRSVAELYAGCVAGAMQMKDYLALIPAAGFVNMVVQKKKPIIVPDDILEQNLSQEDVTAFKASNVGIYSISVYAEKPM
jgi:ubiquinone/menaquinone biosynthesis C-methylase UbiE